MIREAKERWSKPSPRFFKKITKFFIVIGGVGTVLITAPISLPIGLVTLGGYLVTAGAVGGVIAKFTVDGKQI